MIENKVYKAIILRLEQLEHIGAYNGNAHHLAQDLSKMVSVELLSRQQRLIYDALPKHIWEACDANTISQLTALNTKNISSQIRMIQKKTNLIGIIKFKNERFKYYKF